MLGTTRAPVSRDSRCMTLGRTCVTTLTWPARSRSSATRDTPPDVSSTSGSCASTLATRMSV